jgi:unsaturated rhamnogalacturonyl hydrolase
MLLDYQFMLAPFYTNYARVFKEPQDLDDVLKQFSLLDANARDSNTGLMYHAWDESKEAVWANKTTGTSPDLWARGMGWYLIALVDTLQYLPASDAHRKSL